MSLTPLQQLGGATWPKISVAELPGMAEAVDTGRFVDAGPPAPLAVQLSETGSDPDGACLAGQEASHSNQGLISCRMN